MLLQFFYELIVNFFSVLKNYPFLFIMYVSGRAFYKDSILSYKPYIRPRDYKILVSAENSEKLWSAVNYN